MSSPTPQDTFDATLDRLFAKRTPVAGDFAARTLARLRAEEATTDDATDRLVEEALEAALRSAPREPSIDFTARTVARAKEAQGSRRIGSLLPFRIPLLVQATGGMAAAVALLFSIARVQVAENPTPADTQFAARETPAAVVANPVVEEERYDEASVLLMLLAEGIDEKASWAIEENDHSTLLALVR